jgi:pimeloyl-ACP methyl ester carboxylesterase
MTTTTRTMAGVDYVERGAGEAAICLVHAGVTSAWFGPLFDQPALDGFRVIRPIRPGYGGSGQPAERASLAAHARACGDLLHGLGVQRAVWVGMSSSCCIGLQLAIDDPELVAGLVLYEPAKPSGPIREADARSYVAPAMAAAAAGDTAAAFDIFLRGVGGDGYRDTLRALLGEEGLAVAVSESAYFFADEMPALAAWQFGPEQAAAVRAPTLLVGGTHSPARFAENIAILADMLPSAVTHFLHGGDHLAPLARPADFAAIIADFAVTRAARR